MRKFVPFLLAVMIISPSIILAQYSNAMRIKIEGYGYSDETVVRFLSGATPNFDGAYDAWKLFSPNPMVPSIYSKIQSGDELSINSLPVPVYSSDVTIEVYTSVAYSGLYTVTVEEIYAFDDDFVLSITNVDGEETYDITGNTTFTCVLQPNTTTPTFTFNVAKTISTSIQQEPVKEDFKILTNSNGNFDLLFNDHSIKSIMVYDITGKTVLQEKTTTNLFHLNLENQNAGFYFIVISDETSIKSKKIYR